LNAPAPIKVALLFECKTDPRCGLTGLAAALTRQVNEHLGPAWGLPPVEVYPSARPVAGHWVLALLDDADQADALGYHDVTSDGLPVGKVFVAPTLADGQKVPVTASHELIEMLIDPACNLAAQADDGRFYAFEVADAVQDNSYAIDGVPVSDFVYPAWFESFRAPGSTRFSHLGTVDRPFELAPGGYISIFRSGAWTQIFGDEAAMARFSLAKKRRAARRATRPQPPAGPPARPPTPEPTP
jgi:hypothetical protein